MNQNNQIDALVSNFKQIEAEHIAALNGWGSAPCTPAELSVMEQRVQAARKACLEAGIEVEGVWESIMNRRKKDEGELRAWIPQAIQVKPLVPPNARTAIAVVFGLLVAWLIFNTMTMQVALIAALPAAALGYVLIDSSLAEFFPSPAIRIGRKAAWLGVDVIDVFQKGTAEFSDYQRGFHMMRMRMRTKGIDAWVKVK